MNRIRIKNFGPIKNGFTENDGWLDIKKVSAFIGNQGSGKSVVAKLISTFTWIEKVLTRGDHDIEYFEKNFREEYWFNNQILSYHRIEDYYSKKDTVIDYEGESFKISLKGENLFIEDAKNGSYALPQILYMPAERNFIANVRTPKALSQVAPSLLDFVTEFYNAANAMKEPMLLPVNDNVYIEYSDLTGIFHVKGNNYSINLTGSSSGFQSVVPLFLVSWFLSESVKDHGENAKEMMTGEQRERVRLRFREINENPNLTEELRRLALSELGKEFTKTAFINIVEEPEQNLFPSSQWGMLKKLLEFNNGSAGNKLIMTTHSPYLINYLSIAIQAEELQKKLVLSQNTKLSQELYNIVPKESFVAAVDVVIYQLDEKNGTINKLSSAEGIPSDDNYLNQSLRYGNEMFDKLLEIEQEL